jgi:iron complex outermembrane receptor protein
VNNDNSGNQSNVSSSYYGEYQFQRKMETTDGVLTAGLVGLASDITAELYGDTTFTSLNLGAYIQYDQKLFDKLNISFGARYEFNELNNPGFAVNSNEVEPSNETDGRPVFRVGANYAITDYTFLRASWGQGYRYPSIAEKFIFTQAGAIEILPNPGLDFETGWTAELGIKQGFKIASFQGFVDIAAFTSRYDNMIEFNFGIWDYGFGFSAVNIGGTEISGAEITIAGKGKIGNVDFTTLMGYTYIDPTFESFDSTAAETIFDESLGQRNSRLSSEPTQNILKYRSNHLFKFDAEFTYKKFSLGLESFYNSHIVAIDDILNFVVPDLGDYREVNNTGFLIFTARTAFQFTDELKLSLILENLTNQEYSRRPGLLDAPRNITARVDYRF